MLCKSVKWREQCGKMTVKKGQFYVFSSCALETCFRYFLKICMWNSWCSFLSAACVLIFSFYLLPLTKVNIINILMHCFKHTSLQQICTRINSDALEQNLNLLFSLALVHALKLMDFDFYKCKSVFKVNTINFKNFNFFLKKML